MTDEEREQSKRAFLLAFKEVGYKNKACDMVHIAHEVPSYWVKMDASFAAEFDILKAFWKEKRKEELDIVIFENAKNKNGFMDRMAWFRSQGYEEYNPKSTVKKDDSKTDQTIKNLANKVDKYKGKDKKSKE